MAFLSALSSMYGKDQRDRFYEAYTLVLRRAPEALRCRWEETIVWVAGSERPYFHKNVAVLLPGDLWNELEALCSNLYLEEQKSNLKQPSLKFQLELPMISPLFVNTTP